MDNVSHLRVKIWQDKSWGIAISGFARLAKQGRILSRRHLSAACGGLRSFRQRSPFCDCWFENHWHYWQVNGTWLSISRIQNECILTVVQADGIRRDFLREGGGGGGGGRGRNRRTLDSELETGENEEDWGGGPQVARKGMTRKKPQEVHLISTSCYTSTTDWLGTQNRGNTLLLLKFHVILIKMSKTLYSPRTVSMTFGEITTFILLNTEMWYPEPLGHKLYTGTLTAKLQYIIHIMLDVMSAHQNLMISHTEWTCLYSTRALFADTFTELSAMEPIIPKSFAHNNKQRQYMKGNKHWPADNLIQ